MYATPRPMRTRPMRQTLLRYALVFCGVSILCSLGFHAFYTWYWAPHRLQDSLPQKMAYYKKHAAEYDLVFLGDSRTYCGVHPHLVDELLGTRSYNLSSFANWFPTQYPLLQDLLPVLDKDTLVVWSIGHQNFFEATAIRPRYPVGLRNAARYVSWGFSPWELWENIAHFNPFLQFFALRTTIRESLLNATDKTLWRGEAEQDSAPPNEKERTARELRARYKNDPKIQQVEITRHEGRPTSLILYTKRGSYLRRELDPAYFRAMQRDAAIPGNQTLGESPEENPGHGPEPRYWKLFTAMLDLFAQAGADLVVNEFEEAPYRYRDAAARKQWREFMRDVVQREVERRGFGYVRVDFSRLGVEHYFDYNHLNAAGAAVFTPMLAAALEPFVPTPRQEVR